MNTDGPRETGSMSMDIGDGAVSCCHPHRSDSVEMNSTGSSAERTLSEFHPGDRSLAGSVQSATFQNLSGHPSPNCERLPGADDFPQLMVLAASSSSMAHLEETGDIYRNHGFAKQHRVFLSSLNPSAQDVTLRKRKRTDDMPHTNATDNNDTPHDDTSTDNLNPRSRRRTRLRLREQQDKEFSPLLIMSPVQERNFPTEEETISEFHYPPPVIDASHSIRRHFHLENPPEHSPRILQSISLPSVDNVEDPKEPRRSDSDNSFAEVALANTATPKPRRLSTLQDFWLPRPFQETERPSLGGIKVHERGLDVPPSFFSTSSGGRMGGLWASHAEPSGSPTDTLGHSIRLPNDARTVSLRLETSTTVFFDKPMCDSPDSIEPDEDPAKVIHGAGVRVDTTPQGQSPCRSTGNSDGT